MNEYTNLSPRGVRRETEHATASAEIEREQEQSHSQADEGDTVSDTKCIGIDGSTGTLLQMKDRYDEADDPWESEVTEKSDPLSASGDE